MITRETIEKIHAIFIHLQAVGQMPVQRHIPEEENRKGIVITKEMNYQGSAKEVYCNTASFNRWHHKIWEKRKKAIPHQAYLELLDDGTGWRIGFKC